MWIKTCDGEYLNTDYVVKFGTHGTDTYALVVGEKTKTMIARDKDARDEIVLATINGTELLNYGGMTDVD